MPKPMSICRSTVYATKVLMYKQTMPNSEVPAGSAGRRERPHLDWAVTLFTHQMAQNAHAGGINITTAKLAAKGFSHQTRHLEPPRYNLARSSVYSIADL